jgi:hypothetical protein
VKKEVEMNPSGRIPDQDFPTMEGPVDPTEDDYADLWIPECDGEFGDMSMMEKTKALVGDRRRGDDPAQEKTPE